MPLIQNQVVDLHHWLTLSEFTDLITIAEMTPGPIAINSATFVGIRIAGFGGAVIATIGSVLPACVIISILTFLYFKYKNLSVIRGILGGLRPTIVALIASAGLTILIHSFWEGGVSINFESLDYIAVGIFASGLVILRKWKVNPMYVMLGSGILGGAVYLLT